MKMQKLNLRKGVFMNLQSIENWSLYLALTDIKNIDKLKMYLTVSKLNTSVHKQELLDKQTTEELGL